MRERRLKGVSERDDYREHDGVPINDVHSSAPVIFVCEPRQAYSVYSEVRSPSHLLYNLEIGKAGALLHSGYAVLLAHFQRQFVPLIFENVKSPDSTLL